MNSGMVIQVTTEQGQVPVTVFHITGEINTNSYEQLQQMADDAYATGMRDLLLDLSGVSYISSAGLRAIHYIHTRLRNPASQESNEAVSKGLRDGTYKAAHFKLLNPTPAVSEVLKTSGFDMYLDVHKSLPDAVASF